MTTGLTPIIGYQQHEIIGKDINILIPKIFHKSHDKIFRKSISKAKLGLYQSLSNEVKKFYLNQYFVKQNLII